MSKTEVVRHTSSETEKGDRDWKERETARRKRVNGQQTI
jgi:hypothetical protein